MARQQDYIKYFFDTIPKADPFKSRIHAFGPFKSLKDWYNKVFQLVCIDDKEVNNLVGKGFIVVRKVFRVVDLKRRNVENDTETIQQGGKKIKKAKVLAIAAGPPAVHSTIPCNGCGRKGVNYVSTSRPVQTTHTFEDCYLMGHPNRNNNKNVTWEKSEFGLLFAKHYGIPKLCDAIYPEDKKVVPKSQLKRFNSSSKILDTDSNVYFSAIQIKNHNFNFLRSFISIFEQSKRNGATKVEAAILLDSGCLAGDIVSRDMVDSLDGNSYITYANKEDKVCSGLDSSCYFTNQFIKLKIEFCDKVTNKIISIISNFKIVPQTPIDIVIGKHTLIREDMVYYNPTHSLTRRSGN